MQTKAEGVCYDLAHLMVDFRKVLVLRPVEWAIGVATVKLARTDGAVILPSIEVSAYVVGSLIVVSADVLIGNDVVTGSGGMSMLYAKDGALTGVTFGPSPAPDVCGASHDHDTHPSSHVQV